MSLCKMTLFVILFSLECALTGFSSGRIPPGMFEYSHINGWMNPGEAAMLCENDLQCGGFTFHGTLSYQIGYEVYFFHYVLTIKLVEDGVSDWDWTSYMVNRYVICICMVLVIGTGLLIW